jgi:hypothetical protein
MRLLVVAGGVTTFLVALLLAPFAMYIAALTLTPAAVQAQLAAAALPAAGESILSTPPVGGQTPGPSAGPVVAALPRPPHREWATIPIATNLAIFARTPAVGFDTGGLPFGQCTWYVARERGIVAHANGADWVSDLADRGFIVSKRPTVGAILSFRAFGRDYGVYGHVALVVAVDPDGRGFTVAEGNVLGVGLADVRWVPITDPAIVGFVP